MNAQAALALIAIVLILCPFHPPAGAQDAATPEMSLPPASATVEISLRESLALVLQRNLQIEVEKYFPLIAAEDVLFERGEFDPVLDSIASYSESESQGGIQFRSIFGSDSFRTKNADWRTAIRKKTTLGTEVEAGYELTRDDLIVSGVQDDGGTPTPFRFHNEEYQSRLFLDLNQPLLRGFGTKVNTANIEIARNREEASFLMFLDRIEDVLAATQKAYWSLVFEDRNVEIAAEALELAQSFLKIAEARRRAGTALEVDVLEAQADVAAREADLLQARTRRRDAEDLLRTLLRLTDTPEAWDVRFEAGDEPVGATEAPDLNECITEAFANRYDFEAARLDIEGKDIQVTSDRNQQYPDLDIFGTVAGLGLENQPGRSLDTATDGDYWEVTGGIRFSYALGNNSAEGRYRRSLWERRQAIANLDLLSDQIVREVRAAWRQISIGLKRIEERERARVFAERKLESQQRLYEVGRATSTDVLDFQEDLTVARIRESFARIDYLLSWVDLDRARGTVANQCGVKIDTLARNHLEDEREDLK
jgi:outer membrane protein TolC